MAEIGQALPSPEGGWKRIDDTDINISFSTGFGRVNRNKYGEWNSTVLNCSPTGNIETINFIFYGTKLRIMNTTASNHGMNDIEIDGVKEEMNCYTSSVQIMTLVYEKSGLNLGFHNVTVSTRGNLSHYFTLDCIDIDSTGYLCPYIKSKLNEKSKIEDMDIGDIISCDCYMNPNAPEYFMNLGCAKYPLIPEGSIQKGFGSFYFIKVDDNKLIADRNIQHTVSWNKLNSFGYIDGVVLQDQRKSFVWGNDGNNYMRVEYARLKPYMINAYTIRIRVHKEDWSVGRTDRGGGERLISTTQSGGFNIYQNPGPRTIVSTAYIGGDYVTISAPIPEGAQYLDIISTYDGTSMKCYINGELLAEAPRTGVLKHSSTSYAFIGGEGNVGDIPETGYAPCLANAKVHQLSIYNKAYTPEELIEFNNDDPDLIMNLDPRYSNVQNSYVIDSSKNRADGFYVGTIGHEYKNENIIITTPDCGVAYAHTRSIVPIMTSYETSECKLSASTELLGSANYEVFKAFNGTSKDIMDCWVSAVNSPTPHTINIDLKDNEEVIHEVWIQNRTLGTSTSADVGAPKEVSIHGSVDGIKYTEIGRGVNPSNDQLASFTISCNGDIKYRHYKVMVESQYHQSYCCISQINMLNKKDKKYFVPSTMHKNEGSWPDCNDWDTYVVNGNLDGKIIPSDSDIWNYKSISSVGKCKAILNMKDIYDNNPSQPVGQSLVMARGYVDDKIDDVSSKRADVVHTDSAAQTRGFRPMIVIKAGDK